MQDNKWTSGNELKYLKEVLENKHKDNSFCDRLEEAFAEKYDAEYAISLNSGTSGLHAALYAAGIKPGDEVITTPFTVLVDSSIPIFMGAKVKYADVNYDTHNIDPESVRKLVTDKTKAIIPVSYHGCPYEIDPIMDIARDHHLFVLEDDAQAHLAKYKGCYVGRQADMTMFSFERTKHMACGEGGILITNDAIFAEKARKFSGMGFKNLKAKTAEMAAITPKSFQHPNYKRHDSIGLNYRFTEFCAAVALAQFERIDELVKLRRDIAKLYDELFKYSLMFKPQTILPYMTSSYFTYAVKSTLSIKEWEKFYKFHQDNGGDDFYAGMGISYTEPIMVDLGYYNEWKGRCPVAEDVQSRMIQFKTNYRSLEAAERQINILEDSIQKFGEI